MCLAAPSPHFLQRKNDIPGRRSRDCSIWRGLNVGRHWLMFSSRFLRIVASGLSKLGLKGSLHDQRII
jgi:hypothetical protein